MLQRSNFMETPKSAAQEERNVILKWWLHCNLANTGRKWPSYGMVMVLMSSWYLNSCEGPWPWNLFCGIGPFPNVRARALDRYCGHTWDWGNSDLPVRDYITKIPGALASWWQESWCLLWDMFMLVTDIWYKWKVWIFQEVTASLWPKEAGTKKK